MGETKAITHGFKMLFFVIFRDMSRKGYCVAISRRNESILLRELLEFTEERLWTNNTSVLFERHT